MHCIQLYIETMSKAFLLSNERHNSCQNKNAGQPQEGSTNGKRQNKQGYVCWARPNLAEAQSVCQLKGGLINLEDKGYIQNQECGNNMKTRADAKLSFSLTCSHLWEIKEAMQTQIISLVCDVEREHHSLAKMNTICYIRNFVRR